MNVAATWMARETRLRSHITFDSWGRFSRSMIEDATRYLDGNIFKGCISNGGSGAASNPGTYVIGAAAG